jgi:hypothetical protein
MHDVAFRMIAAWALKGAQIVPVGVGLSACKHHHRSALRARWPIWDVCGADGRLGICHGDDPSDAGGSTTEISATGARNTLAGDMKQISRVVALF